MPDLTAPAPNWAAIGSFLVGAFGVLLAVISSRRASRAAVLAERAEARSIIADDRAEEAHTIIKTRFATDQERESAALDAPSIVERWIAELNRATESARIARRRNAGIQVDVSSLAERLALNMLREKREALSIREITVAGNTATLTRVWAGGIKLLGR